MAQFSTIVQKYADIIIAHSTAVQYGTEQEKKRLGDLIDQCRELFQARILQIHLRREMDLMGASVDIRAAHRSQQTKIEDRLAEILEIE